MIGSMQLEVDIPTADRVVLRGRLDLPDGGGPHPAVLMAHGFSATVAMRLDRFADAFAAAGFAVLAYDHRGFGRSDGEPRAQVDPWRQTFDALGVLAWLRARPEVDAERVALWGSSFSGGEMIVAAALDGAVRAVIAQVPFTGPGNLAGADAAAESVALDARFAAMSDRLRSLPDPDPAPLGPINVVTGTEGEAAVMPQPEAFAWFDRVGHEPGAGWEPVVTLGGMIADPPFDPLAAAAHLPGALLVLAADADTVTPTAGALAVYEKAPEPKQLHRIPGHHFVVYEDPVFAKVADVETAFLREHLGT